jgi:hypothetical protein
MQECRRERASHFANRPACRVRTRIAGRNHDGILTRFEYEDGVRKRTEPRMKSLAYSLTVAAVLFAASHASAQVTPTTPAAPGAQPVTPAAPAPPAARSLPPTRWTAPQIRESFEFADGDSNGELTRAEAQQLTIMPLDFEAMDENKDGVVTRAEYEAVFTR